MAAPSDQVDSLIQYVVVRKDLTKKPLRWPWGSVISNACHASVAAVFDNLEHEDVQEYLKGAEQMRKVVLAVHSEEELIATAKSLEAQDVAHKLWVEQPENFATCLATRPYRKSFIQPLLKTLRLFR